MIKQKVIQIVNAIPYGKVVSYGQIALMAGIPRAAQAVGQILNSLEEDILHVSPKIPWWRVINNAGRISIKGTKYHDAIMQKKLLEQEGLEISKDFTFNIEKYRWRPTPDDLEKFELDQEYIEAIIEKYNL